MTRDDTLRAVVAERYQLPGGGGDRYDQLVAIAMELVARVREVDPQRNAGWLDTTMTAVDLRDLAIVLAAMVDPEATHSQLLGWVWALDRGEAA